MKIVFVFLFWCLTSFAVNMTGSVTGIEQRFYQSVNSNANVNNDYIIPSGGILNLQIVGSSSPAAALNLNTQVELIWDPAGANQIVFSSYSETTQQVSSQSFTGDGVKVMRIHLINSSLQAVVMGAYFDALLVQ